MSASNGKGAPPMAEGSLGPELHVRIIEETLNAWAPHLSQEVAHAIAQQVMAESVGLGGVLQDMMPDSPHSQKHPILLMRLISPTGEIGTIEAPKVLTAASSMLEAAHLSHILALTTSPIARAALYAHGYRLEFGQKAPPPPKPLVILPGG